LARTGSPVLARAEREALESQFADLAEEISEYEALKSGAVGTFKARSLEELPAVLIKARIAKGLTQRKLAEALGLKEQQIQRYEAEDYASANLGRLTAVARALGLEISEIAELRGGVRRGEVVAYSSGIDWGMFPVKEMYKRNWFKDFAGTLDDALANGQHLVKEFVEDAMTRPIPAFLRSRVRTGSNPDRYALLAWQCRVLTVAKGRQQRGSYRRNAADSAWLKRLVQLSRYNDGPIRAREYLEEAGISLVIEPGLQHTYIDGAALLYHGGPVIGLTLRYDRLDNFWFTLLHEIAHVMKHLRKGTVEGIFDDLEAAPDELEKQADSFAGNALIPTEEWETALARYLQSEKYVIQLAKELKISPAIIAGRIRSETNNYTILNKLVGQGEVRKLLGEVDFD
jgi:HTH-type transcriptional regulator/antitoxin HigA